MKRKPPVKDEMIYGLFLTNCEETKKERKNIKVTAAFVSPLTWIDFMLLEETISRDNFVYPIQGFKQDWHFTLGWELQNQ